MDLPGYGYAEVPIKIKEEWQRTLARYLDVRTCLRGVVLLMDCRHPLQELDRNLINQLLTRHIPIHILLTKSDKLSRGNAKNGLIKVKNEFKDDADRVSVQNFSSLNKEGLEELIAKLDSWFEWDLETPPVL